MALRTILPQDFYVEMVIEGDLIGAYVIMHDCDGRGTCGTAVAGQPNIQLHGDTVIKCDQCGEIGAIQQ